jgi:hypothetical protein
MAHYAELNENNEVIYVAYMDNEIITDENGNEIEELGIQHLHTHLGSDRRWVRTSYRGNFRGNYAGIDHIYRNDLDMFISPSPYPSWILNESSGQWEPPDSKPDRSEEQIQNNQYYGWDENKYIANNNGWILVTYEKFDS